MKKTITLELPEEFLNLCQEDDTTPEAVLRGFIGDLCGINPLITEPREDGYNSHGSDERLMAREYYERVGYPYWKAWAQEGKSPTNGT